LASVVHLSPPEGSESGRTTFTGAPKLTPMTKPSAPVPVTSKSGAVQESKGGRWEELRLLYPTYVALSKKYDLASPPCGHGELPESAPSVESARQVRYWFDGLDQQIKPHQLRQFFSGSFLVQEESLRALIAHHLERHSVTADRDKLDFLLAQYFALRAPATMFKKDLALEDVAGVLKPVLGDAKVPPPSWYEPLDAILRVLPQLHSMRGLFESGLIEKGRMLKESARSKGYHPSAELAFCHFNFLMRRAFIRLMHEDVRAVREKLAQLQTAGVAAIDCRRAGMRADEPLDKLMAMSAEWKPSSHLDYAQASSAAALEQLLALRNDVEEALEVHGLAPATKSEKPAATSGKSDNELFGVPVAEPPAPQPAKSEAPKRIASGKDSSTAHVKPGEPPRNVKTPTGPKSSAPSAPQVADAKPPDTEAKQKAAPARVSEPKKPEAAIKTQKNAIAPPSETDLENCLEKIWEQLIAAPPARGRSMATISLGETRFLISSWEVAAFVSDSGPFSEDFRRAVVARAMIGAARAACRDSGDSEALQSAVLHARAEINYLQGRAEQAKRAKDTETAVNLGITVKRLLSSIEDGEKLA